MKINNKEVSFSVWKKNNEYSAQLCDMSFSQIQIHCFNTTQESYLQVVVFVSTTFSLAILWNYSLNQKEKINIPFVKDLDIFLGLR